MKNLYGNDFDWWLDFAYTRTSFSENEIKGLSSIQGINGESIIHFWAIEQQVELVKKLLNLGISANVTNDFGDSPLIDIMSLNHHDMAKLLLENGAEVNFQNAEGQTALHRCYERGYSQSLIDLLYQFGADDTIKDHYGDTPPESHFNIDNL